MNAYEMVVIIVALGIVGKIVTSTIKARHKYAANPDIGSQTAERIRKLEERVKVLERIVTSDRYDLNQKFKNLDD